MNKEQYDFDNKNISSNSILVFLWILPDTQSHKVSENLKQNSDFFYRLGLLDTFVWNLNVCGIL